ncbi:MAG TPA: TIGR02301 family protein [Pseudolabrys sp.]|nr:TIGR02301 family protein [Pseudolabrys sp.]
MTRPLAIAALLLCLSGNTVLAQNQPVPPAGDRTAPFDHELQRLAEILGALHYLRPVCGAHDGQKWRNEMQALLDAEAPAGERRRKFVASFNRGYRGFQQTYRTCTAAASIAIRRYLEEGAQLARDIGARYAN